MLHDIHTDSYGFRKRETDYRSSGHDGTSFFIPRMLVCMLEFSTLRGGEPTLPLCLGILGNEQKAGCSNVFIWIFQDPGSSPAFLRKHIRRNNLWCCKFSLYEEFFHVEYFRSHISISFRAISRNDTAIDWKLVWLYSLANVISTLFIGMLVFSIKYLT